MRERSRSTSHAPMSQGRRRRRTVGVASALALLLLTACGRGDGRTQIGLKRIALDVAFAEDDKARPVEPRRIISIVPVEPDFSVEDLSRFRTGALLPPPPLLPDCPKAKPGTFPKEPVTLFFRSAPAPGTYLHHNVGTIKITGGPFPITLPYPYLSTSEIKNVKIADEVSGQEQLPEAVRSLLGATKVVTFDVVRRIGTITVTTSYRHDESTLSLVAREVKTDAGTTVFRPSPSLTIVRFETGENDTWSSAGIDTDTNTSALIQGRIEKREFVDLCGTVYDAWKVISNESEVNLDTGEQSGTDVQQPNVYRFGPHLLSIPLVEEGHFTQVVQVGDARVVLEWDYTSTLMSIRPK